MNQTIAVVVTYNRLDMLKECIENILAQTTPCDILLVDNASTDNTKEWALDYISNHSDEKSKIIYENTGANLGGAGGFNYGMRRGVEMGYDFIWIMDDDAMPASTALEELFIAGDKVGGVKSCGYIGSIVLWTDGTECAMNRHAYARFYHRYFDKLQYGILPVRSSTFVSLLFPKETIEKVGLPIKEYFIWGDDVEYTTRIVDKYNIPSFVAGKSIVIHKMKSNVGSDISTDDIGRLRNYRYAYRNENYTYRHRGFRGLMKYFGRCGIGIVRVIHHGKDHKMKRLGVIFGGMFKGLFFNPKIEYINKS